MPSVRRFLRTKTTRPLAALGLAVLVTAAAAGCGSGPAAQATLSSNETLTITTFGEFGYDDLIDQWNADPKHPFKVKQTKIAQWDDWHKKLDKGLKAGTGLPDVVAIEGDAMPFYLSGTQADQFVDLSDPKVENRWVNYKYQAGKTVSGKLVGYPTDAGPEAICYRADLFKQAGLPSERDKVAKLFTTWDEYFATGEKFVKRMPGVKWYDSSGSIAQAILNQTRYPFQGKDQTVDLHNSGLIGVFAAASEHAQALSPAVRQWTDEWKANIKNGAFATMPCPGWMFANIKDNAPDVKGWDIADAFPGGGGNWGGSYLTVPKQSAHQDQAKEFANWLTDADQEVAAFKKAGAYPANLAAQQQLSQENARDPYFNNAPTAKILAHRAQAVKPNLPFKGDRYSDILLQFQTAINAVDDGADTTSAWGTFVDSVEATS